MQFGEREAHIRAELGRAGPWSARRPLPAPFSLEQLPRDRQNVMIVGDILATNLLILDPFSNCWLFDAHHIGVSDLLGISIHLWSLECFLGIPQATSLCQSSGHDLVLAYLFRAVDAITCMASLNRALDARFC
jgi:hypothetical protein